MLFFTNSLGSILASADEIDITDKEFFEISQELYKTVGASDYLAKINHYIAQMDSPTWYNAEYDMNSDAVVDVKDLALMRRKAILAISNPTINDNFVSYGIDISKWNGDIDWAKVKDINIDFVIIRGGFGGERTGPDDKRQVDPKFTEYMTESAAVKIDRGVYWYSYATTLDMAAEEAYYCLDTIKGYKLEYPVFFDIEEEKQKNLGKQLCTDMARVFCSILQSKGYVVGIYSYRTMLVEYIDRDTLYEYPIWVAEWTGTTVLPPQYPYKYAMWQYSSKGRIPGINGDVDLDVCYVDFPTIMKIEHKNGY